MEILPDLWKRRYPVSLWDEPSARPYDILNYREEIQVRSFQLANTRQALPG